jgi:hypothetical protein
MIKEIRGGYVFLGWLSLKAVMGRGVSSVF